jgi:hypothetical protein
LEVAGLACICRRVRPETATTKGRVNTITVAAIYPIATLAAARAVRSSRERLRPESPAELAQLLLPGYVVTPAIKLLSNVLKRAVTERDGRYIVSLPPRSGKTKLTSVVLPLYALMCNPDTEVMIKSYGDQLAEESSGEARRLIAEHTDLLGFQLSADRKAVGRWLVEGHRGGMLAGGILGGTVGFGADLLIIDDPVRNAEEAGSPAYRRRLLNEMKGSLLTRLMPGGSVVLINTRWDEADLAGSLLSEPGSTWETVNIPAISTAGVPDALGRRPGVAMCSPIGRTAEDFEEIRRQVGERVWAAQYLGVPSTPTGG